MSVKIFISYSHKDEDFKDELIAHLSSLKRQNKIDLWHDRCITAGTEWKEQIDSNLADSDIVLFLVSSDFLASDYCMNKEAQQAMQQHDSNQSVLIPIIIRSVDWHEENISRFQGLPKDGKAVNTWSDRDTAWLNVIEGIKKVLGDTQKKINLLPPNKIIPENKGGNPEFLQNLNITDIKLSHSKLEEIKLSDIFVYPDVVEILNDDDVLIAPKSSEMIFKKLEHIIFFGEEQVGKTSLLKIAFLELYTHSPFIPLLLSAPNIKQSNTDAVIKKAFCEQYENLELEKILEENKLVILIDDFDKCQIKNNQSKNNLIRDLKRITDKIIVSANESFRYIIPDISELNSFHAYEIKLFGYQRREELIKKWLELGDKDSLTEEELFSDVSELTNKFKTIISNNIVPSKPIYLIIFLQMQEAVNNQNVELSSYGHYYQQLIYQSFENARISKNKYDKYINILSEFAYFIFQQKEDNYSSTDIKLQDFFKSYERRFLVEDSQIEIIDNLIKCSILSKENDSLKFKYPYIFYFFVGKKIADGLGDSVQNKEIQNSFELLLDSLHLESHANILIFLTHHTKNRSVLNQITEYLQKLFKDQSPAKLTRDEVKFMTDFIQQIPDLVLEQRNVRDERNRYNENLDKSEAYYAKSDLDKEFEEEMKNNDLLSNINKSFKAIEIAGQIIKNRHASIEISELTNLAQQGILTGLRFLQYFITLSEQFQNEILEVIQQNLREHPSITNEEIEKNAENIYLQATYGVIYGVLRKIAMSIGSREALSIYQNTVNDAETDKAIPANLLIYQSIQLSFGSKSLNISTLQDTYSKIKDNPVCIRLLKELVIQHTYMFPVNYQTKQKIASLLKLPFKTQVLMDKQKRVKV
ncbi:toll/interleukin-1 receptor domain-containing protein [Neisseria sp. 83E34]|uniref:toll/interleukin-1 receptor domain-containing protein n=1 Tax=Neisseria sp. 83E34 TaxID=1692264 RepID=UPI0006CE7D75|nr:toll/interleukin-1 receptor domain-containing protein [Neisseria sp. 83E34]KPN71770.1 hypothetical protein AKG09_05700 [Neisseria sp. 83E34]